MKIGEIKNLSKEELARILNQKRSRILNLRFDLSKGVVKNVKELKELKKDVARILTVIRK